MNVCMDEYLKTINVWAISSYNISSYVRKCGKYACVIDVMALIMDREPHCLIQTLKYMLETYPCRHSQVKFPSNNDASTKEIEIGMTIEDLIPFLCNIPGRECRYRLYRYAEPILKYLDGDQFLVKCIVDSKEKEDENIIRSTKRKCSNENYKSKIAKLREFELYLHENTCFPVDYVASDEFYQAVNKIKETFYSTDEDDLEIDKVNEMRKEQVENFMYIEETSKLKKTDEITFNQVIKDLGYEDDFFKRIKCYELGGTMKEKKGHRKIAKKGKSGYIFTMDDLEEMKEIVKEVYKDSDESLTF